MADTQGPVESNSKFKPNHIKSHKRFAISYRNIYSHNTYLIVTKILTVICYCGVPAYSLPYFWHYWMNIQSLLTVHYCFCSVANRENDQLCHYGTARWLPVVGRLKEKCKNNKYGCGYFTQSNMHTKPDLQYQFAKCHDCQVHNRHNECIYNIQCKWWTWWTAYQDKSHPQSVLSIIVNLCCVIGLRLSGLLWGYELVTVAAYRYCFITSPVYDFLLLSLLDCTTTTCSVHPAQSWIDP